MHPPQDRWLTSREFAAAVSLSRRNAARALSRAYGGFRWRGYPLAVRAVQASGGRSGTRFEVLASSLPPEYRSPALSEGALNASASFRAQTIDKREWQWRLQILAPAIAALDDGKPIAPVMRAIASQADAPSVDTLETWLRRYRERGVSGLIRQRRADVGKSRVLVSREWDRLTVHLSADVRRDLAAEIEKRVRSLWAAGAPGWKHVAQFAKPYVAEITRAAGVVVTDCELSSACELPRHFVRRFRRHAIVSIKRGDAKKFYDRFSIPVRRDRSHLLPMQVVEGDVHHVDIYYRRADGSVATPKAVAWLDLATNRLFASIYFLEKGKGITQEHVIRSFIDMTQSPGWGWPESLMLDNGAEYGWTDFVEDALQCAAFTGRNLKLNFHEARPVQRARPYNARAKAIESIFRTLEYGYLTIIPGHVGGERTRKKTANVGKEPDPFPGTTDELRELIAGQITRYEITPQSNRSHLAGKSPRQAYEEHLAAGWQPIVVERHHLEAVFAHNVFPTVRQGTIRVSGLEYVADELAIRTGEVVHVRVPKTGDKSVIAVLENDGRLLCFARPVGAFAYGDPAGARHGAEQNKFLARAIADLARDTEKIDLVDESKRVIEGHPLTALPQPGGRLEFSPELRDVAEKKRALPAPTQQLDARIAKQRRRMIALTGDPKLFERKKGA
jgi:hypothetical protein